MVRRETEHITSLLHTGSLTPANTTKVTSKSCSDDLWRIVWCWTWVLQINQNLICTKFNFELWIARWRKVVTGKEEVVIKVESCCCQKDRIILPSTFTFFYLTYFLLDTVTVLTLWWQDRKWTGRKAVTGRVRWAWSKEWLQHNTKCARVFSSCAPLLRFTIHNTKLLLILTKRWRPSDKSILFMFGNHVARFCKHESKRRLWKFT